MIASAEEFVRLRSSQKPDDYYRAGHEAASISVWLDVIARYPDYRRWVAYNKTVPTEILQLLSKDSSWRVRHSVAMKNKLTPELLEQLATDPDDAIRAKVARHKKTSPDLLRKMVSEDTSLLVREAAEEHLEKLRSRGNQEVLHQSQ